MRKEDITSFIVYLVMIAGGVVSCLTFVSKALSRVTFMQTWLFATLVLIISVIINAVGLELLHMLGAKIGGYKVVKVSVFKLGFEKVNNAWKFGIQKFDGFTGETRIVKAKEKTNLKAFVWAPFIGFLLELGIGMLVYFLTKEASAEYAWLNAGSLLFIVIAVMLEFYNIVPLKLDSTNDGYRLVLISKEENIKAFEESMRIEDIKRNGNKVESVDFIEPITDFTAASNLNSVYYNIVAKDYQKANEELDKILVEKTKLSEDTLYRILSQKLYVLVMSGEMENAQNFYHDLFNDKVRRFIANDEIVESQRAYLIIAGLLDKSKYEVERVSKTITKALKKSLKTTAEEEGKLIQEGLEKIYQINPDWKEITQA